MSNTLKFISTGRPIQGRSPVPFRRALDPFTSEMNSVILHTYISLTAALNVARLPKSNQVGLMIQLKKSIASEVLIVSGKMSFWEREKVEWPRK